MRFDGDMAKGSRRIPCEEYLSLAGIAEFLTETAGRDVTVNTIKGYYRQGRLPAPDVIVGRNQGWSEESIRQWQDNRPGQGARTDLRNT